MYLKPPASPEAFWDNVDRSAGPDGCWPWTGARNHQDYGYLTLHGRSVMAHRVAYVLDGGQVLANAGKHGRDIVRHRCDNPPCCNPRHLLHGTARDNAHDAIERGRFVRLCGEQHGSAKLTAADVAAIRAAAGIVRQVDLARRFGVSQPQVSKIQRHVLWREEIAA